MRFRIDRIDPGADSVYITVSDLGDIIEIRRMKGSNETSNETYEIYRQYSYSFKPNKDDGTPKTVLEAKAEIKDYCTIQATNRTKQITFSNSIGSGLIGKIL